MFGPDFHPTIYQRTTWVANITHSRFNTRVCVCVWVGGAGGGERGVPNVWS